MSENVIVEVELNTVRFINIIKQTETSLIMPLYRKSYYD